MKRTWSADAVSMILWSKVELLQGACQTVVSPVPGRTVFSYPWHLGCPNGVICSVTGALTHSPPNTEHLLWGLGTEQQNMSLLHGFINRKGTWKPRHFTTAFFPRLGCFRTGGRGQGGEVQVKFRRICQAARRKSPFHSIANICLHGCLHTYKRERFIHLCIPCSFKSSFISYWHQHLLAEQMMNEWTNRTSSWQLAPVAGLRWCCWLTCGLARAACQGSMFSSSLALMDSPRDLREILYNCSL